MVGLDSYFPVVLDVTEVSFAVLLVNSITTLFAFFAALHSISNMFLFSSSRKALTSSSDSRVVGYLMASGRPILFRIAVPVRAVFSLCSFSARGMLV